MRILATILLLTTGCQTIKVPLAPPMPAILKSISEEHYVEHLHDCSNKSAKYARILRENGHHADLIVTEIKGRGHHAVVVVALPGGYLYCDPTQNKWSTQIDAFGIPKHYVPFEKRLDKKWAGEFMEIL